MLKIVSTTPYTDQKMGTAGLRRKSKVVVQPNYIENFLQSIFNTIGNVKGQTYIVGGDGRFYNDIAIQKLIKMAAANDIGKLIIGQNGFLSTPASSNLILKNKTDGGFVLSASHNPGGENGDFGIKYANHTGGQVPTSVSDKIYANSKTITEYKIMDCPDIDLSALGSQKLGEMEIEVIDPNKPDQPQSAGIQPLYPTTETMKNRGLSPKAMAAITQNLCKQAEGSIPEILSQDILSRYQLMSREQAFIQVHHPLSLAHADCARVQNDGEKLHHVGDEEEQIADELRGGSEADIQKLRQRRDAALEEARQEDERHEDQRNDGEQNTTEHTFQADFTTPLGKQHKVETGVKYILRNNSSDNDRYLRAAGASEFLFDEEHSTHYRHQNDIIAAYLGYGLTLKKLSGRLGVRYEHTIEDVKYLLGRL